MPEQDPGGKKFSRRDLLSFFRPKKSEEVSLQEETGDRPSNKLLLTINRRELLKSAIIGSSSFFLVIPEEFIADRLGIPTEVSAEYAQELEEKYSEYNVSEYMRD